MTNLEVLSLYKGLSLVKEQYKKKENGIEQKIPFSYKLIKNLEVLEKEVKEIKQVTQYTGEALKYEKDRIELCKEHALKDAKGGYIFDEYGQFTFADTQDFTKIMSEFNKEREKEISERDNQIKKINKFLESDSLINSNLVKFKQTDIPMNLPMNEYELIYSLILDINNEGHENKQT